MSSKIIKINFFQFDYEQLSFPRKLMIASSLMIAEVKGRAELY